MTLPTPLTPLETWAVIIASVVSVMIVAAVIWMFIDAIWQDR